MPSGKKTLNILGQCLKQVCHSKHSVSKKQIGKRKLGTYHKVLGLKMVVGQ